MGTLQQSGCECGAVGDKEITYGLQVFLERWDFRLAFGQVDVYFSFALPYFGSLLGLKSLKGFLLVDLNPQERLT